MTQKESTTGVVIGILLIFGSIISYLPQYYKIIKNKHVNGISHWSLGLNNIASFCAFFGSFMLDYHIFRDCPEDEYCNRNLIPFVQLMIVWLCPLVNYIIYIKYYYSPMHSKSTTCGIRNRTLVYSFFGFYVLVFLCCFILTTIVLVANWTTWKNHGLTFGKMLNVFASLITAFVWIPQIFKTYKEKNIGSLSLLAIGIQAPGTFMIFIFQVVLSGASWFIGFPYLVTSIFQFVLLAMGIYFERQDYKHRDLLFSLYEDGIDYNFDTEDDCLVEPDGENNYNEFTDYRTIKHDEYV
jgi:uncharacterized protein with PQ loop repeat